MKKALGIIGKIFTILVVIFTVFVMVFTIVSFNTVGKDDANLFGYKPYIVLSNSMQEQFSAGDIQITKTMTMEELETLKADELDAGGNVIEGKEGDIITFKSIDPSSYGEVITHRIRAITTYEGQLAFTTYGTATGTLDAYPAIASNVVGKYTFHLPKMGTFFQFLRTTAGYFTIILIPFLFLILTQAVRFFRLMRRYRLEQKEILDAQREQMASEQQKTQDMMEELERLKAQLAGSGQAPQQAPPAEEAQPEEPAEPKQPEETVESEEPAEPVEVE